MIEERLATPIWEVRGRGLELGSSTLPTVLAQNKKGLEQHTQGRGVGAP